MNKFILFVAVLFALFALTSQVSAGGLSSHGESSKIKSLLTAILDKFAKGKKENKSNLKKANSDLHQAESDLVKAQKTFAKESSSIEESMENNEAEERLIRKILAMLSNDLGKHQNHVALSCDEVMKDESAKDGYYWVNVKGSSQKIYCARQNGRIMFSGACNAASRGNGWGVQCLNEVDFNKADSYLSVKSNGVIKIKRDGIYRITAKANMYSESWRHHFGRILINGNTVQYQYHNTQGASTETLKVFWPLKKGNTVQATWYINAGSHSVRYAESDNHDGSNRLQIEYVGEKDQVALFSGGCTSHRKGASWGRNCVNRRDWTMSSLTAKTFSVESNGDMIAKKSGFYQIQAVNLMHNSWHYVHADIKIDGKRILYSYSYSNSWRMLNADVTYWVNAGQRMTIKWLAQGSSPYSRHGMGGNNGYNRMQIIYKGGSEVRPYLYYGGCNSHNRSKGWQTYCLNSARTNELKNQLTIASGGKVTVKQSGFYRINARALVLRKQNENAFSRIMLDNKVIDMNTDWGKTGWTEMKHDITLPLTKGQVFYIQYMATNYAYHSWGAHSMVIIEYVDNRK